MKIVTLVSYKVFPPQMGGQKGIALFYQYLSRLTPVTMITIGDNREGTIENLTLLPVISNSRLRYINPFLFFKVKKILRKEQATHLVIEHPYYGWLATLVKLFTRVKLVVHSHNIEYLRFKSTGHWWWRILKWYERGTHRRADYNFFIREDDKNFAVSQFRLDPAKCFVATYGTETESSPTTEERMKAKEQVCGKHGMVPAKKIFLFNGTLDYKPNLDALHLILEKINPILLEDKSLQYTILICGKNLPADLHKLKEYSDQNILYAGLVEDIDLYFKAADLFLNPVISGGGIKTKLIESIAWGTTVVSTETGAAGVGRETCGEKLVIVKDGDWPAFAKQVILKSLVNSSTPAAFYNSYSWKYICLHFYSTLKGNDA
jgi:polysaccharide biosynthesis protein PslH